MERIPIHTSRNTNTPTHTHLCDTHVSIHKVVNIFFLKCLYAHSHIWNTPSRPNTRSYLLTLPLDEPSSVPCDHSALYMEPKVEEGVSEWKDNFDPDYSETDESTQGEKVAAEEQNPGGWNLLLRPSSGDREGRARVVNTMRATPRPTQYATSP